ncbi:NUDIX domain-containing protein [Streptomyces sp. NBC_00201]|uniref:NUDIX domain-containing protein n=1 Tax=unclassified Streptomyces TaxID=2593676 RepID=UPI0022591570|nr:MULTISPECIES: NUDIX domain-containing protein [unclassified Streptomyces]MCX5251805.1 NUDIX domain-containing protein [Streptomyces sp. NBC_00201]MCX5294292.1 NUDIX domain-containing protein [Streptomyces sp. NBC_00183]
MRELTLRVRVAAYVLRRRAGQSVELLVFDHDADLPPGTHVPAGGVAPEEPLEEAVLREVTEECGLTCVRVLRPLAEEHTPHPIRHFPRHTTFFELEVDGDADVPDAWDHHVTGTGRDNGMTFHCRFEPLPLGFPLADGQDAWLDRLEA